VLLVPGLIAAACGHLAELAYGQIVAVRASDFTVPAASFTTLIGPNGSGKTTLLAAIAGLHAPVAGRVEVLGNDPAKVRARLALVPQSTQVSPGLPVTVREVVSMGRYASLGLLGRFRPPDRAAVDGAIERLGLTDLVDRHLEELSGGQRQRVFVAQGLAQDRDMLLMDEPLTALDGPSTAVIEQVIADERAGGRTVVVTTHDLAEAARSDHVILLAGRVVAEGPPDAVLRGPVLSDAYQSQIVEVDGRLVFDDPAHAGSIRHVHVDRAAGTHPHS